MRHSEAMDYQSVRWLHFYLMLFIMSINIRSQLWRSGPAAPKFAEALTHRDYLGAVMNLGIERSKLGDILTYEDAAVLFVKEELASYITEQLSRVRHTVVKTTVLPSFQEDYEPKYETIRGTVPSIRLDTVLSLAFPISRSKITDFIEGGRVFVNGRLITKQRIPP